MGKNKTGHVQANAYMSMVLIDSSSADNALGGYRIRLCFLSLEVCESKLTILVTTT